MHGSTNRLVAVSSTGPGQEQRFELFGLDGVRTYAFEDKRIAVRFLPGSAGADNAREDAAVLAVVVDPNRSVADAWRQASPQVVDADLARAIRDLVKTPGTYSSFSRLLPDGTPVSPQHPPDRLRDLVAHLTAQPAGADGSMAAAYTYFAQLIGHDISRTVSSPGPASPANFQSAQLDLRSILLEDDAAASLMPWHRAVAGAGVGLTTRSQTAPGFWRDLARDAGGRPLARDVRCDANIALAQITVAVLLFHHHVARLMGYGATPEAVRTETLRHIQAVVLHDWLHQLVPCDIWQDVMNDGRKIVCPPGHSPADFRVPVEVSTGFFRYGHAVVRDAYKWKPPATDTVSTDTLIGYVYPRELSWQQPRLYRDWIAAYDLLADFPGCPVADRGKSIGPSLSQPLPRLYKELLDPDECALAEQAGLLPAGFHFSLAELTLLRGRAVGLPSAQDLLGAFAAVPGLAGGAAAAGVFATGDPGFDAFLVAPGGTAGSFAQNTPLWLYTLLEARRHNGGRGLGPLAGRVVMETVHAAIEASGSAMVGPGAVAFAPMPGLPLADPARICLADLLRAAEIEAASIPAPNI